MMMEEKDIRILLNKYYAGETDEVEENRLVKGLNMIVSALINVGNTISNILSSVFGIQMQQMSATAAAAENVAGGYADAADSMGDYADATKKAAKAAKTAKAERKPVLRKVRR